MSRLMERKHLNQKLTQKRTAKELGFSDSTVKLHRNNINTNTLYRLHGSKRSQVYSMLPLGPKHTISTASSSKSCDFKGGALLKINVTREKFLD